MSAEFDRPESAARALAHLSGASRCAVVLDDAGSQISIYGNMPALQNAKIARDCAVLLADTHAALVQGGAQEGKSLVSIAWSAGARGLVVVRLNTGPKAPFGIVIVEHGVDFAELKSRASIAATLVGISLLEEADGTRAGGVGIPRIPSQGGFATCFDNLHISHATKGFCSLAGIDSGNCHGRPLVELLDRRSRRRALRMFASARSIRNESAVFSLFRETGAATPCIVTMDHAVLGERGAVFCSFRALTAADATREIVGRVATAVSREPGSTIRAERLLNEAADALDLRLLAFFPVDAAGGGAGALFAAGPAVPYLDEIYKMLLEPGRGSDVLRSGPVEFRDLSGQAFCELHDLLALSTMPVHAPSGDRIGVLVAFASTLRPLFEHESRALAAVSELLATDLERRRAELSLERRARELDTLLDAVQQIASLQNPGNLVLNIVERAVEFIPNADGAGIFLLRNGVLCATHVHVRGVAGESAGDLRYRIDEDHVVCTVFRERRARCVALPENRKMNDPDPARHRIYTEIFRSTGVPRSALLVPLFSGTRTIGVLTVTESNGAVRLSESSLELLQRFAVSASAAIVQSELFDALQLRSALVEAVRDGIATVGRDGLIQFMNEGARRLFLLGSGTSANRFQELFEASEVNIVSGALEAARATGYWQGFARALREDSSSFDAAISITLEPRTHEFVVIISDITERRMIENRALQTQTLDNLGKLAAGIAHDFNNLLGSIFGFTSLLRGRLAPDSSMLGELNGIDHVADEAASLARRLLVLGRHAPGVREPIDLNPTIQGLFDVIRRTIDRSVDVQLQLSPRPCVIDGDETALRQAILNLVTNARDALRPGGGMIRIQTEFVDRDRNHADRVRLIVSDNGSGMEQAVLRRLYQPFFTTKPMGKGSGLGSAIVFATVRSHGGTIDCESTPGTGTTFTLTFPAGARAPVPGAGEPATLAARPSRQAEPIPRGTGAVLIVEDDEMLRRVNTELVASLGYEAIAVPGGREAIEVVRARGDSVDLVLLDLTMPGMSGTEVFDALRALQHSMRIIITTGYASAGAAEALLERGAIALLPKPFRQPELARVLAEGIARPVQNRDSGVM